MTKTHSITLVRFVKTNGSPIWVAKYGETVSAWDENPVNALKMLAVVIPELHREAVTELSFSAS
jgi:hypothetical protein